MKATEVRIIGAKVRIIGPAYHNAIGTIVPRIDRLPIRDLCWVRLDGYLDEGEIFVLLRLSEVEVCELNEV